MFLSCIRFQEIAGSLDSALLVNSLVHMSSEEQRPQDLILKQSDTLLKCLRSCWSDDVLVLSCSDKFLRLSLQLLSRQVLLVIHTHTNTFIYTDNKYMCIYIYIYMNIIHLYIYL